MRVLFWSDTFWPQIGGVEVLAAKLLPALQARGFEFAVVAPKSHPDLPDQETFRGVPVRRFRFFNDLNLNAVEHVAETREKLIEFKRSFAPKLVHLNHAGVSHFFHLITSKVHASPTLFTLHGEWPDGASSIVGRTLRSAQWVAGCSAAILNKATTLAPEILPRSSVIYNAVEKPPLAPASLPFDAPRLLCLGRLAVEKGFDVALNAFASVARRFAKARLIIAGDGPARRELEQQTVDLELTDRVDFLGWVDPEDVAALINTSTLLVIPSRLESFPLVALQAGLMARPIVASAVGGLPEVVLHGETGLLFDQEDKFGFVEALSFLLSHPATAIQMGKAARSRVQTMFSWETHVNSYDTLYRQLIEKEAAVLK